MRALVVDSSAPGRIALRDVPEPVPAPGEVLVEVRAFSLNRGELRMLRLARMDRRAARWSLLRPRRGASNGRPGRAAHAPAGALHPWSPSSRDGRLGRRRPLCDPARAFGRRGSDGVGQHQLGAGGGTSSAGSRRSRVRHCAAARPIRPHPGVGGRRYSRPTRHDGRPSGHAGHVGNSSDEPTTFNVRDVYNAALVRPQGFELFFGGDPFGRDLAYLVSLMAEHKLDPQLAGELPWEHMTEAMERLRNRDVAGKVALTLGN